MGLFGKFKKKPVAPVETLKVEEPVKKLEPVVKEFMAELTHTEVCKETLNAAAVIYDKDGNQISHDEAFRRYYGNNEYFRWEFPLKKYTFEVEEKAVKVFGDGIYLGDVLFNKYTSTFSNLVDVVRGDKIDHVDGFIKNRSAYFFATKAEYDNTPGFNPETDDVYKRGVPSYAEGRPHITIQVFYRAEEEDGEC